MTATAGRATALSTLLIVWCAANVLPHLTAFLITGKLSYQLPAFWGLFCETALLLLNLLLPPLCLVLSGSRRSVLAELGWTWPSWRGVLLGLGGLLAAMLLTVASQQLIGRPVAVPGFQLRSQAGLFLLLFIFLVLTAPAEETMFRGYLQTALTRRYGAVLGICGSALLFGLRYLPLDLYGGLVTHASTAAWVSRLVQLYSLALLLGVLRHLTKSLWISWMVHQGVLVLILFLGLLSLVR
jgi:membrane protease YdiL (CAAX protease family)